MQSKENTAPLASLPLEPISLRDYFAGQALAGVIADLTYDNEAEAAEIARGCYRIADAMLAARTGDAGATQ